MWTTTTTTTVLLTLLLLSLLLTFISTENFTLTIVHTGRSDTKFEPRKGRYGIARVAHFVKDVKSTTENVLYFETMDCFSYNIYYTVHGYKICADFMNLLLSDAHGLGCSELREGVKWERAKILTNFLKALHNKTILCSNCEAHKDPRFAPHIKTSNIFDVGGRKVGVTAYIGNIFVSGYVIGKMTFGDDVTAIRHEIGKMKQNGANIIILIAHDRRALVKQVIKRIQDVVDVVVGGHSTGLYYNGVPPTAAVNHRGPYPAIYEDEKTGHVLVEVRCGQDLNYVGKLHVTFDDGGNVVNANGNCYHMGRDMPEDTVAKEKLEEYAKKVRIEEKKVVGSIRIPMPLRCHWRECNLGNFITDAYMWFEIRNPTAGRTGWTNAAIAVINSGALRTGILLDPYKNNTVRELDITSAIPWETSLVVVKMKGRVLKKAMEHGVDITEIENQNNRLLQVSGIKVVYDMSKDRLHRVVALRARCRDCDTPRYEDVNDHHDYYVVMSEYLRFGGDKYYMFANESSVIETGHTISDTAALRDHVKKVKMLQTGEEQRIRIENCPRCGAALEDAL